MSLAHFGDKVFNSLPEVRNLSTKMKKTGIATRWEQVSSFLSVPPFFLEKNLNPFDLPEALHVLLNEVLRSIDGEAASSGTR